MGLRLAPAFQRGTVHEAPRRLQPISRVLLLCFACALFLGTVHSHAQDRSISETGRADNERYGALRPITFFGSITASVYRTGADKPGDGLSSEEMTRYLRELFSKHFTDIPFREVAVSQWSNDENRSVMGRLLCRIWVETDNAPGAFQVKCLISTSDRVNIIDDTVLGYGPSDKLATIVQRELDRMMSGFAAVFSGIRKQQ